MIAPKTFFRSIKAKAIPLIFYSSIVIAAFVLTGLLKALTGSAMSALIVVFGFLVTHLSAFRPALGPNKFSHY